METAIDRTVNVAGVLHVEKFEEPCSSTLTARGSVGIAANFVTGLEVATRYDELDGVSVTEASTVRGASARTERRALQRRSRKYVDRLPRPASSKSNELGSGTQTDTGLAAIMQTLKKISDHVVKLEERLTEQTSHRISDLRDAVHRQEIAFSKMRRERDEARLKEMIAKGKLDTYRQDHGIASDASEQNNDSHSNYEASEEASMNESEKDEETLESESASQDVEVDHSDPDSSEVSRAVSALG